jgi:tetratricopeptide (TPR) repeat protein
MNPENVDILIAMYRLDGDEVWRNLVMRTLQVTTRQVDQSIQDYRDKTRRFGLAGDDGLGYQLNQYAWLVSNTEGDKQKALDYSLESLEIETDSARLDTCARCYFALGDLDSAIRTQKRAIKMMPYSPAMLRQLGQFQAAKERQMGHEDPAPAVP